MRRIFFVAVALFQLLLLPSVVHAWGADGHELICLIAEERMTPAAKAAVGKLLGGARISDDTVCNWPDHIRAADWPESAGWHFVDIPFDATQFDEKRDGARGNNLIDEITYFESALKKAKVSKQAQANDLTFMVHFVGDLHQPMHCIDRHADKGGNKRLVFLLNRPRATNLHSVWDSGILLSKKGDIPDDKFADTLNARITPQQASEWAKGTLTDWANESHQVAVDYAYKGIPEDGPPPKLNQVYVDAAEIVIEHQLEKGGVRLATILNDLYK